MKILYFDIETAYMRGGFWNANRPTIPTIVEQEPYILMIGYMWEGDKEATILSLPDHKTAYKKDKTDDSKILAKFLKEVEKADAICGHNVGPFDWAWVRGQAYLHGFPPPPDPYYLDTLKMARNMKLRSRKLDYILQRRELGAKIQHRGITLWRDCMDGDLDAWQEMADYCRVDVEELPALYKDIRPWGKENIATADGTSRCTKCNAPAQHLKLHSYRRKKTSTSSLEYRYLRCDICKGFSWGKRAARSSNLRGG